MKHCRTKYVESGGTVWEVNRKSERDQNSIGTIDTYSFLIGTLLVL